MLHKVQLKNATQENEEEARLTRLRLNEVNKNAHTNHQNTSLIKKKPVRNDPCPCESGKKYKNCCGMSVPKKGIFAK